VYSRRNLLSGVVLPKYRYLQANNTGPEFSAGQLWRKPFSPTFSELTKRWRHDTNSLADPVSMSSSVANQLFVGPKHMLRRMVFNNL
jgi:hypothetical protein